MSGSVHLHVGRRRLLGAVLAACVATEVAFVLLDYHVNFGGGTDIRALRRLVNVTREDGLAGWFGSAQTLLVALTAWLVRAVERRRRPGRARALGWLVVAAFFTYMAIDDGAALHERFGTAFEVSVRGDAPSLSRSVLRSFPSYAWQILFVPGLVAMGFFTLAFLWAQLADRTGRLLVLAALGCFAVAVGLDFVEGLPAGHPLDFHPWIADVLHLHRVSWDRFGRSALAVVGHFSKAAEETIEMFGTTLFWLALLRHLASPGTGFHVRFDDRTADA